MSPINIVRRHNTTQQQARVILDAELPGLLTRFGNDVSNVVTSWRDSAMQFSFRARGFSFRGTLEVTDAQFILDVGVPLLVRPFQGRVETAIHEWVDDVFGP